jgi:hypothetical protein
MPLREVSIRKCLPPMREDTSVP